MAKKAHNDIAKKTCGREQFRSVQQRIFSHIDWVNPGYWSEKEMDQEVKEIK